jgi:Tfp pilus assembly protein PilF
VALEKALNIAPDDIRVLHAAARVYALQRDKQKAMSYLTQALDIRYDLQAVVDMDLFNLRTDEDFLRSVTR